MDIKYFILHYYLPSCKDTSIPLFATLLNYFADKGLSSLSYGFPVVMCGCESWTIKKAEHGRIDAFELWC